MRDNNLKNDSAKWMVAIAGEQYGPYNIEIIVNMLDNKKISYESTYVWKEGMTDWELLNQQSELMKKINNFKQMSAADNKADKQVAKNQKNVMNTESENDQEWMLALDGEQYGPFSSDEVRLMISDGQIDPGTTYIWKHGMEDWKLLKEINKLSNLNKNDTRKSQENQEGNKNKIKDFELLAGERLLKKGSANYSKSQFNNQGGRLYLTNKRLVFKAHLINIGDKLTVVNLADIISVKKARNMGLIPNGMKVITRDGEEHKYSVWGRKKWLASISDLINI